jgi:5-methylcytosine-specific restriction endonuclease McrA
MPGLPRACTVCGKRVTTGESRCADHMGQHYATPVACRICGRRSAKSFCPEHDPILGPKTEEERLQRQPWRRGYRSPLYHKERQAVLRRAGGACERCGRSGPLEVDHIVPLSSARSQDEIDRLNERDNLRALCTWCHRQKTLRRS